MAGFGYFIIKRLIFDPVDEVQDFPRTFLRQDPHRLEMGI
jgi:hypothetical protein